MSAEELLKIFPSSRSVAIPMRQMPGTIEAVIIEDFVEDGMHYNITFHVDSSTRRLVRIYQTHNGGDKLAAFDQLETRLKESYGSPSDVTNTDGNSLQAIDWNFPTTQIQLLYTNLVGEYTFVIYELAKRIRTEK